MRQYLNNYSQTLSAPLPATASATTAFTVPAMTTPGQWGVFTLSHGQIEHTEIIRATRTPTGWDLLRGEEGTVARDWPAESAISMRLTAEWLTAVDSNLAGLTADLATLPGHVISQPGPPTAAPPRVGMHWIDTVARKEYRSIATAQASDWLDVTPGGGGGGGGGGWQPVMYWPDPPPLWGEYVIDVDATTEDAIHIRTASSVGALRLNLSFAGVGYRRLVIYVERLPGPSQFPPQVHINLAQPWSSIENYPADYTTEIWSFILTFDFWRVDGQIKARVAYAAASQFVDVF